MKNNILTIDFEDYYASALMTYQKLDLTTDESIKEGKRLPQTLFKTLHLLKRYNAKATFFIVGYIAEKYPDLIKKIQSDGHHIGSHSHSHRLIYNMSRTDFLNDLKQSINALSAATQKEIDSFRAPAWSYSSQKTEWFWEVLNVCGIQYDSSIFPFKNQLYGEMNAERRIHKRGFNITEIPPSTMRYCNVNFPFSGGFYLRSMPYWLIKHGVKTIHRSGHPAVIYIHPYEIFEKLRKITGQKYIDYFIHHYNIHTTIYKMKRLLTDFKFCSIENFFNQELN